MTAPTLPKSRSPGTMAIFIPAWEESDVIGHMLRGCISHWKSDTYRIFVGAYPNDPATIACVNVVAALDDRISLVVVPEDGPTTKGDCLNALWAAMVRREHEQGFAFKAVILHDAEDVVHRDELALFDFMLDRFSMVQIPVLPLVNQRSRWISGHYLDEFSEAHGKSMTVREAVGAALPSAGVGCAFARDRLGMLASQKGGKPFDADCLTEDYELGLRLVELGGRGAFVLMRDRDGELICTREYFPETLTSAVRQKARWMIGISFAAWDRMGWHGGLAERWMRLRDRRAGLSAIIMLAAYLALMLYGTLALVQTVSDREAPPMPAALTLLLSINGLLLLWRLMMRVIFVTTYYGWREGIRSIPRAIISNMITLMAARRAMTMYFQLWRGQPLRWEKTRHYFPDPVTVPDS